MPFSFSTALSGLNANSNAIGVTGNNIANANTTGFRASTITFADVFASAGGVRLNGAGSSIQIGSGVRTATTRSNFSQGTLNEAVSPTNAAIQGNGFFVVRNANGANFYTRAGDFSLDNQGHMITPNGELAQGYMAVSGVVPPGAALTTLQLPVGQTLAPIATSEAAFRMNLNSTDPVGTQFHATMRVYDSLGVSRTLDLTFTQQGGGAYQMTASLDGVAAQTSADGGAASSTPVAFTFNSSGVPTSPSSLSILPDQTALGGGLLPSISITLRDTNPDGSPGSFNITNYSSPSAVSATHQNGAEAGSFTNLSVDSNGYISAVFSNRQTRVVGQFAIATFNSQDSLMRNGNNLFAETQGSGQANIGPPDTGGRGSVVGGVLEQSNVDLASEFVELIKAQRGFQANSRVISAMNQALQDVFQAI